MKRQINEILKKYDLEPVNRQYGIYRSKLSSYEDKNKNSYGVIKGTPYWDLLFIKTCDKESEKEFNFGYKFHPNIPIYENQMLKFLENDIKNFKNNIEK